MPSADATSAAGNAQLVLTVITVVGFIFVIGLSLLV